MVEKKQESKRIQTLKHKARRESIKEGIFASASFSLGNRFISPFAIAINASNSIVAMLSSLAGFLGPLSQFYGSKAMEKHPRKKIVTKSVFLEAMMWIPMLLIAIFFALDILTGLLPIALLLFFSFFTIFGSFSHPAWFSWIGDIVDDKYRGRWFSKRNLLTGFVSVILAISSSFMLDYFKNKGWTMTGFIILFTIAFILRLISVKSLKKQYEPKLQFEEGHYFSFWSFLKSLPKTNFGRFTIFRGMLAFAISISSPFVAVYLLRYLNFDYKIYILITMAGVFFSLIFLEIWGKIADKYGNYRVMALATIIIPIVPLLWIISSNPIYLIFIPSAIGGIVWAGFILASGNFIYDNVSPQKRGLAISYFNMIIGKGVFLGAGLGALLIKYLKIEIIEPLFAIFILGSIIRMLVVYVFLPKFKEVRKIKKFKGFRSLRRIFLHETKPTLVEEVHQIMSIRKYFNK